MTLPAASPTHLVFVCALACEAQGLARHLRLVANRRFVAGRAGAYSVFEGEAFGHRVTLLVSGVGAMKSAIATTATLVALGLPEDVHVVNVGVAGASESLGVAKETLCLVHRIGREGTRRAHIPDIVLHHGLQEARLWTCDRAKLHVASECVPALYDMEAFGIAEAVFKFYGPHQLSVMKIVSDIIPKAKRDQCVWLDAEEVTAFVREQCDPIMQYVKSLAALPQKTALLHPAQEALLQRVMHHCRFTASQQVALRRLATMVSLRKRDFEGIAVFQSVEVEGKAHAALLYERVCDYFESQLAGR